MKIEVRREPEEENDLQWGVRGVDYLLEVDAETPAMEAQLLALRRRLTDRIRLGAGNAGQL